MAKQGQTFFLEEWLRCISRSSESSSGNVIPNQSSPSSARSIIQAWSELRECSQSQSFKLQHLQALKNLVSSKTSLFVADPQARILVSILGAQNLELFGEAYALILRLLYVWVRKSSRPSVSVVDSAVEVLSKVLDVMRIKRYLLFAEFVLAVGALCYVPNLGNYSRRLCLEMLCKVVEDDGCGVVTSEVVPDVLAGVGYAMSSAEAVYFGRLLDFQLGVWDKEDRISGNVVCGLMVLHLTEWVLFGFLTSSDLAKVNMFGREIFERKKETHAEFAMVMAYAGVLRASHKALSIGLRMEVISKMRASAEEGIDFIARGVNMGYGSGVGVGCDFKSSLILQCTALALARCGTVSSRPSILLCLASALLMEIFPLKRFYSLLLDNQLDGSSRSVHELVKNHLAMVFFNEAGAITGVFCQQYISTDEESKLTVQNIIWSYCRDIYLGHRRIALVLQRENNDLLTELEKIAESAFLMVVVFSLTVTKQWSHSNLASITRVETSVKILVSLSCVEYFRRIRLPEYMETVRAVIVSVQENEPACISFVESIPAYTELTYPQDNSFLPNKQYAWSEDEVQTARILFYLRVIPTCIEQLQVQVFRNTIAPTMFLYLKHPNEKVARASHSVYVAFTSSRRDSDLDEKQLLKEQLVFYYIQRSLEAYPGLTPFDGLASGVVSLVRHLPAGSPATFFAIHCLVDKGHKILFDPLCQEANNKNWLEESGPGKKVIDLLSRLIFIVDIQVLPDLMKKFAHTVSQLPTDGQTQILNEMFSQVAESDDVIRKPVLVSWLQSLSYLCSQVASNREPSRSQINAEYSAPDPSSENAVSARL